MTRIYLILCIVALGSCKIEKDVNSCPLIVTIDTVFRSQYESNVFMVQLNISNPTDADMQIVIDTAYTLDISNELAEPRSLTFLLEDFRETDLAGGDNFPEILFTDSADNLSKYNSGFLSYDSSGSDGTRIIPKQSVSKVRAIWTVLPMYMSILEDSSNLRKGNLYFRFPCGDKPPNGLHRRLNGSGKFKALFSEE